MLAILHPNEAVIPLTRGREVPVDLGNGNDNEPAAPAKPGIVSHMHVYGVTNPDDFKRSKGQIAASLASSIQRANMRNG